MSLEDVDLNQKLNPNFGPMQCKGFESRARPFG